MDDLISRRAAIDAIKQIEYRLLKSPHKGQSMQEAVRLVEAINAIMQLPYAQTEIITCKDCVHSDTFPEGADNDMPLKCLDIRYGGVMPDWYCEHAERRTDE